MRSRSGLPSAPPQGGAASLKLSNRQIKSADRVGGANLIIDWPVDLPRGKPLAPDHERRASEAEKTAALKLVYAACEAANLCPREVRIVNIRRPNDYPRGGTYEQHLAVTIVGRRWLHATGTGAGPDIWARRQSVRSTMTLFDLRAAAETIYGSEWQSPLARDLGVALRTVQRWAAGEQQPPDVCGELAAICRRRAAALARLADGLRKR